MVISTRCKCVRLRALATSGKFGTSTLSKIADATSKHAGSWLEPRSPPALQRLYCTSRIVMVPLGKDCEKSFTLCDKIKGSEMVCAHPPTSSTTVAPAPTECSQCGAPKLRPLPASPSRPLRRPHRTIQTAHGRQPSSAVCAAGVCGPAQHHFHLGARPHTAHPGPCSPPCECSHCNAPRCRETATAKVPA